MYNYSVNRGEGKVFSLSIFIDILYNSVILFMYTLKNKKVNKKTMDPQTQTPQPSASQSNGYQPQMPSVPQPPQTGTSAANMPTVPQDSVQPLTPAPQYDDQSPQAADPAAAVQDSTAVAQQIAAAINGGKNVLVTVSIDPSVDELASAVGMTFLLGKLGKHATAVFSGKIPAAMEFLEPEAIFEDTVDSLRDFIIALDKEKADKLRYKVEEDVVKIFITPYKTILSEKDLEYSQGDFNVDVVIALGVTKREELDKAITAHGRILHDATVVTVNAGGQASGLGSIDWHDPEASSVAEMLVLLGDELGKDQFDAQISTAFLTGLVAQTNRFSNDKTSPKVMTTAAQLMASGANQQLVATNLRHEGMISEPVRAKDDDQPHDDDGEMVLDHSKTASNDDKNSTSSDKSKTPATDVSKNKQDAKQSKGSLDNDNTPSKSVASAEQADVKKSSDTSDSSKKNPAESQNDSPAASLRSTLKEATVQDTHTPAVEEQREAPAKKTAAPSEEPLTLPPPTAQKNDPARPHKVIEPLPSSEKTPQQSSGATVDTPTPPQITADVPRSETQKPSFGGTLNATTAEAEAATAAQKQREQYTNNTALSHDNSSSKQDEQAALEAARSAVEDAASAAAFNPANQPVQSLNAEPMPVAAPAPTSTTPQQEPSPVDEFMQPHNEGTALNVPAAPGAEPQFSMTPPLTNPSGASQMPQASQPVMPPPVPNADGSSGLPPLPPMPGGAANNAMPPMPPMPGQGVEPATLNTQPRVTPEFMATASQSQNTWTDAGEQMSQKYAQRDADRQARQDELSNQYNATVERNKTIQANSPQSQQETPPKK